MSGIVSYDLFVNRLGSGNCGFTTEGGFYQTYINNTGTSVKGTLVIASTSIDNAVDIAPTMSWNSIGVIYENGIANGALVKVVVYGKAQVLLKDNEASYKGYWCGVSDVSGRMYQMAGNSLSTTDNFRHIGHSLESKTGGTNVLSLVHLHFA